MLLIGTNHFNIICIITLVYHYILYDLSIDTNRAQQIGSGFKIKDNNKKKRMIFDSQLDN